MASLKYDPNFKIEIVNGVSLNKTEHQYDRYWDRPNADVRKIDNEPFKATLKFIKFEKHGQATKLRARDTKTDIIYFISHTDLMDIIKYHSIINSEITDMFIFKKLHGYPSLVAICGRELETV